MPPQKLLDPRMAEGSGLTQLGLRCEQVLSRSMEDVLGGTLNLSELRADPAAGQERRQEVTLAGRVYDTQRVRLPRGVARWASRST